MDGLAHLLPAFLEEETGMNKNAMLDVAEIGGSCKSRSTSAGSSKHSSSPGTERLTHGSERRKPRTQQIDYPSPFVVHNTVLDYGDIGPPPGLEQFGSSVESEVEKLKFVPVKPSSVTGLPEIEYPAPFVVQHSLLGTSHLEHMGSEFAFMTEWQGNSGQAFAMVLPPGLSSVSHEDFGSFTSDLSQATDNAAFAPHPVPVFAYEPPPPPAAPYVVPPRHPAPEMGTPMSVSQLGMPDMLPESVLGTPDMPTVGSAWHWMGTCKPCAFLHTKGCGSGVECEFCHLCAPGEKKRRKKERQAAARVGLREVGANLAPQGMSTPASTTLAGGWAFPHAATDATAMYIY